MKHMISIVLAVLLAASMGAVAFAADYRPTAQVEDLGYGYKADSVANQTVALGDVKPADKLVREIPLVYGLFDATPPDGKNSEDRLTQEDMRTAGIDVRMKAAKGADVVAASVDSANGVIRVKLAETLAQTEPVPFDVTVYLTVGGVRYDKLGLTFTGTLANPTEYVYADDDYIDLSDGRVVEAYEKVDKIEVYLGEGVSIHTSMSRGKKYYGSASAKPDNSDYDIMDQYVDIEEVRILKTSGLSSFGDIVKLDADFDFYVYNGDMNYLGRSGDMLPYANKYFLSRAKLDIQPSGSSGDDSSSSSSDDGDENTEPTDDTQPPTGGSPDGTYNQAKPGGINPDTGDTSFMGLAIGALVASLVAIGLLVNKKRRQGR